MLYILIARQQYTCSFECVLYNPTCTLLSNFWFSLSLNELVHVLFYDCDDSSLGAPSLEIV